MCKFARKVWRWTRNIREAFGLCADISWRELASGIRPGSCILIDQQRHFEAPLAAWDVFRVAVLWRIWCARCRTIFDHEPFNVTQVCELAWKDTIFAGMASIRQSKRDFTRKGVEKQSNIALEFALTWCRNEVFCSSCCVPLPTAFGVGQWSPTLPCNSFYQLIPSFQLFFLNVDPYYRF
jgi:hypothetical protein